MPFARDSLSRFVRALHRRFVLLRVAERTGLGLLAGCAAALALTPVLLWRGQSAWALSAWCFAGGAVAGLVWGIASRPGRLAAAAEADRQLGLNELLGTALVLPANGPDPWARNVLAVAERRCASLSPSAVVLHRLGARAWGGIGLAAALVLTVASLSASVPDPRTATARRDTTRAPSHVASDEPADRPVIADAAPPARPRTGENNQHGPDRPGAGQEERVEPADAGDEAGSSDAADPFPNPSVGTSNDGSSGAGRTEPRDDPAAADAPAAGTEADPSVDQGGTAVTGTGIPAAEPGDAGAAAGATAGRGATSAAAPPPWRTDAWAADAERAGRAVEAGQVPDSYRDLVREYFQPDRP